MKLNSFLVKSRHGIFYLRLQRCGVDRRISLRTRDPERAKYMAYQFGVKVHIMKNISTYDAIFPDGTRVRADGEDDHRRVMEIMAVKRANEEAMLAAMAAIPDDVFSFLRNNQAPAAQPTSLEPPLNLIAAKIVTLSEALKEYYPILEKKKDANKTKSEAKRALEKMQGLLGADFNMLNFNDEVIETGWMNNRKAEKSTRSVLVDGEKLFNEISWSTVEKELSWIRVFSQWASKSEKAKDSKPAKNKYCPAAIELKIPDGEGENESYEPFTALELKIIFDAICSVADEPWHFWIPLIGLYTGARIGEPSALKVEHFERKARLDTMHLPGTKTYCSPRWVPIHPDLIAMGLLDFVEMRRSANATKLFDFSVSQANGAGAKPSKWFAAFLDSVNIKSKTKVFHSFRHSIIELLTHRNLDYRAGCQYVGHSFGGNAVHNKYGKKNVGIGLGEIKTLIVDKIDFYELHEWTPDIVALKLKADEFLIK